ncbi:MAG: putative sugar nucleotidyl transferase [Chitinophagaceae bacterium]
MIEFHEAHGRENLFPLTLTRHSADIRVGILTIREKWAHANIDFNGEVPANLIPSKAFFDRLQRSGWEAAMADTEAYRTFSYPWELTELNAWAIVADFELMTAGRSSSSLNNTNKRMGGNSVFIEEGTDINYAYFNTTHGPIYVGAGATIMEGAMLRGPLSIGAGAVVKMGTAIYGATTIGPGCVVGGEIKNSIFTAFSNKAHDGYIGDAVIGAWCNLGAGTSCSNIRNAIAEVRVWHMASGQWKKAGIKCGMIMGDHCTCAINSSFNTGTVIGVSANIFQSGGLLPKFIPSFSWGAEGKERYRIDKALDNIGQWMKMKHQTPEVELIKRLTEIYNQDI